jgi:hypothetical protein
MKAIHRSFDSLHDILQSFHKRKSPLGNDMTADMKRLIVGLSTYDIFPSESRRTAHEVLKSTSTDERPNRCLLPEKRDISFGKVSLTYVFRLLSQNRFRKLAKGNLLENEMYNIEKLIKDLLKYG